MEKVKIAIDILRDHAIEAGLTEYGWIEVAVDPGPLTTEQRAELVAVAYTRGLSEPSDYANAARIQNEKGEYICYPVASTTELDVTDLLTWRIEIKAAVAATEAKKATAQAEREKAALVKIRERVEAGEIKFQSKGYGSGRPDGIDWSGSYGLAWKDRNPEKIVKGDRCEEVMQKRLVIAQADFDEAATKKTIQVEKTKKEAEKLAEEKAAETDQRIRELIEGDELDRYERGFFSEQDERDLLRGRIWFDRDENLDRYERLKSSDIEHENEYCEGDIEFDADEYEGSLTEEQFGKLREIEGIFVGPEWTIEVRRHVGECESCDGQLWALSVLVSTQVGKYNLSREYALDK